MPRNPDCPKCDGCGWVTVRDTYAERAFPRPAALDEMPPGADRDALLALWRAQLAAARNSVYPCKECEPTAFYRWAAGHLDSGHARESCAECLDAGIGHPHRRRRKPEPAAAPATPGPDSFIEPKDRDF